jgi:hypothetical protein
MNFPFYQNIATNKKHRNKNGFDITFYDRPEEADNKGSFFAELSLIGDPNSIIYNNKSYNPDTNILGKKNYSPIFTLKYGFEGTNKMLRVYPIIITQPSSFHLNAINKIK